MLLLYYSLNLSYFHPCSSLLTGGMSTSIIRPKQCQLEPPILNHIGFFRGRFVKIDGDSCCCLKEITIFIPKFKTGNFAERKKNGSRKNIGKFWVESSKTHIEILFLVSVASTHNYIDVGLIEVCVLTA